MKRFALQTLAILLLSAGVLVPPAAAQSSLGRYPVIPRISGGVASQARALIRQGKRLGNRLHVFSKVGDSITAFGYFLTPIGAGGLQLGAYGDLGDTVNFFSAEIARTNNSFANESLAARPGWTSADLLDPNQATVGACNAGETPLDCELRVVKPAVALIMIGTNDLAGGDVNGFRARLTQIVRIVKSYGVIPVLSTIPYRKDSDAAFANTEAFNLVIVRLAQNQGVPLWNYWLAVDALPANGISTDNVHPSVPEDGNTAVFDDYHLQYGFTMRNLTALQVLNALRPVLQ